MTTIEEQMVVVVVAGWGLGAGHTKTIKIRAKDKFTYPPKLISTASYLIVEDASGVHTPVNLGYENIFCEGDILAIAYNYANCAAVIAELIRLGNAYSSGAEHLSFMEVPIRTVHAHRHYEALIRWNWLKKHVARSV